MALVADADGAGDVAVGRGVVVTVVHEGTDFALGDVVLIGG